MNKTLRAAVLACALASASMVGGLAAQAQTTERVYDQGTVWRVNAVQVKPGMMRTYMANLASGWRVAQENAKKKGDVISYKVLEVDSARDNEPNLFLMVEYRNMAVFDESLKDGDARTTAVFGSLEKAQALVAQRETMRTQRGETLLRELKFTN